MALTVSMKKENVNLYFGKYFEYTSYNLTTCLKTLYKNVLLGYPQTFSKCLNAARIQSVFVRMMKMKMTIGVMMMGSWKRESFTAAVADKAKLIFA